MAKYVINLKKKNTNILINGRITKKHLKDGKLPNFSKIIFNKFDLCLSSNKAKNFLKNLGAKNIKYIGNLKFSQSENEKIKLK